MMTLLCVQDFCLECQCLYFCILLDIVMCGMHIFCDFCWFWGLCCYPIFISLWSLLLILLYSPPLFGHSFIISLSLSLSSLFLSFSPSPSPPQSDLESHREVSKGEGDVLAKEWQCPFFETSAKDRVNIDETFHELVRRMKRFQSAMTADKGKGKKKGGGGGGNCLMM